MDLLLASRLSSIEREYVSLQKAINFDITSDFINCDQLFWSDGDHWSNEGEKHFSKRLIQSIFSS